MRETIQWNDGWKFRKDGTETWESVTLPHTWNAQDGQDGGSDYYQGSAWYQKHFIVTAVWKQVYIRFGAVSKMAEIWCNGKCVGQHRGGFSAFTLELTPFLLPGENELTVRADNSNELTIYPRQADFTFFGGIYRDVELICFDKDVHFDVERIGTDALLVTPDAAAGKVKLEAWATGGDTLAAMITDADGNCVAEAKTVVSKTDMIPMELSIPSPHRWNGLADPYLYHVTVVLSEDGADRDSVSADFGFRDFSVNANEGFCLNGVSYPLHGVCRHQDREDMGWAITEKEHLEDMALIREIGANTIRLAHYQQAAFFYDLCDRNGIVVWAEIPFISVYDPRGGADENLLQQMRELVLQNYNHPSICFWGIANEIGIGGESEAMYKILRELNRRTKELDPTRLTAIANVGMTQTSSPLFHITDVTSYNEYKGWYEGTAEDHGGFCDEKHGEIPDIPLAISEYGAESVLRWHSAEPKVKDYTEEYQAIVHEKAYEDFAERPYLWATWLWNMFDFAADARNEGGCKGRNNKGLVTYDRKTRKQAFYFYKARWSGEPFVYLCGKRFLRRAEEKADIKAYSNQPSVELWLNGKYFGKREGGPVFLFRGVELEEGFNELLVRTPEGCADHLILERVSEPPEEYVYKEVKEFSGAVTQWFSGLTDSGTSKEITVRDGYLSVNDPLEEVYSYPEGFQAVQEIIAKPLAIDHPEMAGRMEKGGPMSFHSIWNHISRMLPDEAYYLLNERLNKIKKETKVS